MKPGLDNTDYREEANTQFKRDWLVEEEILHILRERMHDCFFYEKGTGLAHLQVRVTR